MHSLTLRDPAQPTERYQALKRLIEKVTLQMGLNEVCICPALRSASLERHQARTLAFCQRLR